ncbi:MAG: DNA repair protein RecN [Jatrophihabitans sp.]|uniref:DNA repair protein RecN n=1 Tax=Jatrophihabitans sp. TaxID=1932789 RepID=UPI003F8024F3
MLDELRIRGLGVIDEAVLPLGPGLTVVTGETGAGKTMVVTGLLLLFGGRADSARVRTGSDQASVDGRLHVPPDGAAAQRVRDAGGELDDDELILRRVVGANGRSRGYVGGAPAPVAVLGELAEQLLAVHGQSDQLRLTRPGEQRAALDRFAGLDLTEYVAAHETWTNARRAYDERVGSAAALRRESDLLQHGLAEIERVDPQPGEDVELEALARRLGSADALRIAAQTARAALSGADDAAVGADADVSDVGTLLGLALRALGPHAGADAQLDGLAGRLADLAGAAGELASDLSAYADDLDADPQRLDEVQTRRAAIASLVRKYGESSPDVAGVLQWAAEAAQRLAVIDVSDDALAALRAARDAAGRRVVELAAALSQQRRAAADDLAARVSAEVAGLAMPDARVLVRVSPRPAVAGGPSLEVDGQLVGVASDGIDEVELLLQPHPSAPALPIGKGASGGELSRVMLALEVCLADTTPVPTFVFDEVDAGVGGRAAVEIGRRLARLARDRQVVVVTHLAQVAAYADRHVVVDKPQGAGGSVVASDVRVVEGARREGELARMLAGSDTATALEHAAELLAQAAADRAAGAAPRGRAPRSTRPDDAPPARRRAPAKTATATTATRGTTAAKGARKAAGRAA